MAAKSKLHFFSFLEIGDLTKKFIYLNVRIFNARQFSHANLIDKTK